MMNRLIFLLSFALLIGCPVRQPTPVASKYNPLAQTVCRWDFLYNGNFEQGEKGWLTQTEAYQRPWPPVHPLIGQYLAYDWTYSAKLGGERGTRDTIQQTITIPKNGQLIYQWLMQTYETTAANDVMLVGLLDLQENSVALLNRHDISGVQNTWQMASADLSASSGQQLNLRFEAINNGYSYSTFFVDAVHLYGEADCSIWYMPLAIQ